MKDIELCGRTGKPHGLKGHVALHIHKNLNWNKLRAFFLQSKNDILPYLIEDIFETPKHVVVKFQDINSVDAAKKLSNTDVYIEKKFIDEDELNYDEFTVTDILKNKKIGSVTKVLNEKTGQWIVVVGKNKKEILLPFHQDLIDKIDKHNKTIYYKAPDGIY